MLWEHKSILPWALVINMAGHQRGVEHTRRLKLLLLVKDRHTPYVPLRPNIEAAV